MYKYLISASSEYEGNHDILTDLSKNKLPFFKDDNQNAKFQLELVAEKEQENAVIETALAFKKIYRLNEIQLWKKEVSSSSLYSIGISFYEDGMELLLGHWTDWSIGKNDSELIKKDEQIK